MSNDQDLDGIFDRIANQNATDEDIQILRQLRRVPEGQNVIQIGKYSVNIAEGRDLHIGDKIYESTDAETIRTILLEILADKDLIDKTFQRLFSPSESSVDWDWGMNLLEQKQLPDICTRLTDPLGRERILMDVSIEERQRWVNRSPLAADRTLQVDGRDCGVLDANKMLIETFGRNDIKKKLLILGAPGAGKTTALLSLAEQLVEGAISKPRTVIPVIFELSTWRNDNQSIESWLIEQLYDLHGGNRKSKLYEQWLERQVLLPLMDGLDELGLERQKKCTEKLNEFAEHYPHLVVCCRVKEFETVDIKLRNLRGAVCLQSLSDLQIQHYFDSLQRPELWGAIQTTPSLQAMLEPTIEGDPGLLRVPLFVKLVVDVYEPQQPISSKADLLDKYIDRQLSFDKREIDRRKGLNEYKWAYKTVKIEPDYKKTRSNLCWLARNLQINGKVEFLLERMQRNLLDNWLDRLIYALLIAMCFGLIAGTIVGAILFLNMYVQTYNLFISTLVGLFIAMFVGIFFGLWSLLAIGYSDRIDPVETLNLSKKNILKSLGNSIAIGCITWVIYIMCFATANSVYLISTGASLIIAVALVFILELNGQNLQQTIRPNEGIWRSLKNALLFAYIGGIGLVVLIFIMKETNIAIFHSLGFTTLSFLNLFIIYFSCILAGLLFGLTQSGTAFIQHFILRVILAKNGLPLNFVSFLNYCVERRLLLRVGGSYRFLHRELLDHFAQPNH
jgi:Effector-associated domain 10/NACHT domain